MKISLRRVLAVTLGLSALGVICGGLLGGVAVLLDLRGHIRDSDVGGIPGAFTLGATTGAMVGAVLAPLVGWVFLRRVSLGRAIAETALGVLAGILVGAFLVPSRPVYELGLGGFLLAAAGLWFRTRRAARDHAAAV